MKAEAPVRTNSLVPSRVVIDTHVWLSAALSAQGAPAQCVRRVLGHGLPVFCESTYAELESRIWKAKFDRYLSLATRKNILHDARAAALWIAIDLPTPTQKFSRDADDDKFIHTAMQSRALWLVTGDQDLLSLQSTNQAENLLGIQIVSPAQALDRPDFPGAAEGV
jgi:uncharacterized protein